MRHHVVLNYPAPHANGGFRQLPLLRVLIRPPCENPLRIIIEMLSCVCCIHMGWR